MLKSILIRDIDDGNGALLSAFSNFATVQILHFSGTTLQVVVKKDLSHCYEERAIMSESSPEPSISYIFHKLL